MKTVKDVLIEARELISGPKRWTTGYFAKTDTGGLTTSCSENAVCWCAFGAIRKSCDNDLLADQAAGALTEVMRPNIAAFNDHSPHEDVIAAFDIAICLVS